MSGFAVGHRVIAKPVQAIYPELAGCFGHVVEVERVANNCTLLMVNFLGRVGGELNPVFARDPWPCWSAEVEHAD